MIFRRNKMFSFKNYYQRISNRGFTNSQKCFKAGNRGLVVKAENPQPRGWRFKF
jgi:hypothetical protein